MSKLTNFRDKILSQEDKPLFDEAIASAEGGALRGAYILVWICCAESLKRKLREAATRDNRAQQIITEIETREASRQSADSLILKRANEYELIDDVALQKLTYIYDMRCVYGHPYESAPTKEELLNAVSVAVSAILEKPTLYRKKYVETLIERLTRNVDFLERSKISIQTYAREISVRIDPESYRHLANVYSSELEKMCSDPSLSDLVIRGIWFLPEFLKSVGTDFITEDQWHDFVLGCPRISQMIFLKNKDLYDAIGKRADDSLVSYALTNAALRPTGLKLLEAFWEHDKLSAAQRASLTAVDFRTMKAAHLKTSTAYNGIITELKSRNWPRQNAAIEMLNSNDRLEISRLNNVQQDNLGRNILQAADGDSGSAIAYLISLNADYTNYPKAFIKGILLEGFINESNSFRLKKEGLKKVLPLFSVYPDVLEELLTQLDTAQPTGWVPPDVYNELINETGDLAALKDYLVVNKDRLAPPLE